MHRSVQFRGRRTHGRGKKAGRGAGKRGGRGNAGLHKHKYITTVKFMPDHFGRHGFKRPQSVVSSNVVMNLKDIREHMDKWIEQGMASKKGDTYHLNATDLGVDKLLATGSIDRKVVVTVAQASHKAIEKIESAGGKVELKK